LEKNKTNTVHLTQFLNPGDIPDIWTSVTGSSRPVMLYVHMLLTY